MPNGKNIVRKKSSIKCLLPSTQLTVESANPYTFKYTWYLEIPGLSWQSKEFSSNFLKSRLKHT